MDELDSLRMQIHDTRLAAMNTTSKVERARLTQLADLLSAKLWLATGNHLEAAFYQENALSLSKGKERVGWATYHLALSMAEGESLV